MGDRASAESACKDPNPIIDGRKANVNLAILGAKPRGNLTPGKYIMATKLHCNDQPLTISNLIALNTYRRKMFVKVFEGENS